jgi:plastocyanin
MHIRRGLVLAWLTVTLMLGLPAAASAARSRTSFASDDIADAAPDVTVMVTLTEFSIIPQTLSVPLGMPVTFVVTNTGGAQHNLEVEHEGQGIEQRLFATNLVPGETRRATFTFTVAGEWEMYCPVGNHRALGMRGTILVVQSAEATPTPLPPGTPTATPTPTAAPVVTATSPPAPLTTPTAPPATLAPTPTPRPQLVPTTGRPSEGSARGLWASIVFLVVAGSLVGAWRVRRLSRR